MSFDIPLANPDLKGNEAKYALEAIETGRIGTYEAKFTIPNLNKEEYQP